MRGCSVPRVLGFAVAKALFLACCFLPAGGHCERVLVVTTCQRLSPSQEKTMWDVQNGEYVVTDLVAAGYPFDVVTYDRFVEMDLGDHDIIFVNGHTGSIPISQVAAKCQEAIQASRKVFINGYWSFRRYNAGGQLIETLNYAPTLFPVSALSVASATGAASVPACIEKDPSVTNCDIYGKSVIRYTLNQPALLSVTISGYTCGFLYANGGLIDSQSDYFLNLLDYGKVVSYLRFGGNGSAGFANDRIEGMPVASFEVHCDLTYDLTAIANLDAAAAQYGVSLYNLLVYRNLNTSSKAAWNAVTNPLMRIGSHSRTHPNDWPSVPDLAYETTGAIAAQRLVIPATQDYFNFSGAMNPTTDQIDQLSSWGLTFGASGWTGRYCPLPVGGWLAVQTMPTNRTWFVNLSQSTSTAYCPSQTLSSDHTVWHSGESYLDYVKDSFAKNVKYGLYTYGYVHDYHFDPYLGYATNGILMYDQIKSVFEHLNSQGAKFVFTDDLVRRLKDYQQGSITRDPVIGNPATVTVTRPNACANEIKIGFMGDWTPAASGSSVLSQRLAGEHLYVTLKPETTSTVTVNWSLVPPVPPVVKYPGTYISTASVIPWEEPLHPSGIAEYQYAVGTTPGAMDAQGWVSAGTSTSGILTQANLQDGETYYVSVRSRYAGSGWSNSGVSGPLVADMATATTPVVVDGGQQQESTTYLYASWSSSDPETGVVEYCYAIGTKPGDNSVLDWTYTTDTVANNNGLTLVVGQTYYTSVKAKNGVGLWSAVGASDGITIVSALHMTVGVARRETEGTHVVLDGVIVTAVFDHEFYVESPDKSAGLKVISDYDAHVGDRLDVDGYMCSDEIERTVDPILSITPAGSGDVEPVCMSNGALGGANDPIVLGPTGGIGLNNVALLVKTPGKILSTGTNYILIDDGSKVPYIGTQKGVRVSVTAPHSFQTGSYVVVTGISTLYRDSASFRRMIRTRSNSDVQVLIL